MKRLLSICLAAAWVITCFAQTVIDNFDVGPYVVDYNGQGDVKYRLRDNIDLFEYFELQKDTTIMECIIESPVRHAIEIAGRVGANRFSSKEIGIDGVWKQQIGNNLYFNGGVALTFGLTNTGDTGIKRNMLELGIPLQIEWCKLNYQKASFYGLVGVAPAFYSTLKATGWNGVEQADGIKKSGLLIEPTVEVGGNIPAGCVIMRIGVYGTYKANCTPSDYNVYNQAGRMFLGAKIAVIL